jgi:Fe-S oxidoreductase/nitrate reductase gamma subunit
MEATREIYWNVGSGAILPMYISAFIAIGLFALLFLKRISVYRLGKGINRTDNLLSRLASFITNGLFQIKVLRSRIAGGMHALFFWGFLLLFIGTLLIMLQVDFTEPLFGYTFLEGWFYLGYSLTLDIAGLVAVIMLGALFVRRFFAKQDRLETGFGDAVLHILLFTILITGFMLEGLRMAATELKNNLPLALWSPVGMAVAKGFSGMDGPSLKGLHLSTWWVHFALVLAFIVIIPLTKLRHIFTTPINYIFADNRPRGSIETLDLEDESAENFGAASVKELTWKDIFDSDACTECKRCQDVCPAYATGKPLSPMKVVTTIRGVAFGNPEANLIEAVSKEALWACTTCFACQETCPASIEHVNKILEMRRSMVLMEGEFSGDEVKTAVNNVEVNGNPLGMAFSTRGDWAEGEQVKILAEDTDVDILFFAGCYSSFDKRNIKVAKSFLKLCGSAGVKVGMLGKEEKCCGEPVRKLGNEYLYQMSANENIEKIKGYGVKKVVTTCPHCFNTLDRDYRDLGFDIEVEHHATFLNRLINEGKLKLNTDGFDCTYHDSCYIGRYKNIFDEPRNLIASMGGKVKEMKKSRSDSFCCGAGGGMILAEEKSGTRISVSRVGMAEETGTGVLVSNCPFCLTMFEDGVKSAGIESKMVTKDIAEILAERLLPNM